MGALGRLRRKIKPQKPRASEKSIYTLAGRNGQVILVDHDVETIRMPEMVVPPHPSKYPAHARREKGAVLGGECNRTACGRLGVRYFNRGTYGYYCMDCARGINGNDPRPLCEAVDHNLTHDEMNVRYRELWT